MELTDAKISSTVNDNQIPPLLSMIIEGLPPMQQSKYTDEAEIRLKQYTDRYQNIVSFEPCCISGFSFATYVHHGVVDVDRLLAIGILYGTAFVIDDLFIDNANPVLLEQCGIDPSVIESSSKLLEYLDHLDAVLGQTEPPQNHCELEVVLWEVGHNMLQMSNPEWFKAFVASVNEFHHICAVSHAELAAGENSLELYTTIRAGDVGGEFQQMCCEFASNAYLPCEIRAHPYMQKVTTAAAVHEGFSNDVYSYLKESLQEGSQFNLITVLMRTQGLPRVQAVHAAIQLVNEYARIILDLESAAWNSALQLYLNDIKEFLAGNIYFGCVDGRYREPDSVFPEQRDMTVSWKASRPCPVGA